MEKQAILDAFHPDRLTLKRLDWLSLVWIGGMHVGAVAAPFFFTWEALGVRLRACRACQKLGPAITRVAAALPHPRRRQRFPKFSPGRGLR